MFFFAGSGLEGVAGVVGLISTGLSNLSLKVYRGLKYLLFSVRVGLVLPFQLPTPHSTTITSGGQVGACDSTSVTHTTLYYNHYWWCVWGV